MITSMFPGLCKLSSQPASRVPIKLYADRNGRCFRPSPANGFHLDTISVQEKLVKSLKVTEKISFLTVTGHLAAGSEWLPNDLLSYRVPIQPTRRNLEGAPGVRHPVSESEVRGRLAGPPRFRLSDTASTILTHWDGVRSQYLLTTPQNRQEGSGCPAGVGMIHPASNRSPRSCRSGWGMRNYRRDQRSEPSVYWNLDWCMFYLVRR